MVLDCQSQELQMTQKDRNHVGQNSIIVVVITDSESIPVCRESLIKPMLKGMQS